ncbi:hypothetical protein Trydic_g2377 [Trypoxylus dichotomus]
MALPYVGAYLHQIGRRYSEDCECENELHNFKGICLFKAVKCPEGPDIAAHRAARSENMLSRPARRSGRP